jgi:glutathione peroxidase
MFLSFLLSVAVSLATGKSLYDFNVSNLDGKPVELSSYKGKVVLVVNTASKCGYTGQYKGLEAIHKKYENRGFTVLGFPSNDFLGQEPGTNEEIKKFCSLNYGVTFPIFAKNPVKGDSKQPVYKFLTESGPKDETGEVRWNFEKFLVDQNGQVVARFRSSVDPEGDKITSVIEKLLK